MKAKLSLYFILFLFMLAGSGLYAQSPQAIHYQAVARDGNAALTLQAIQVRFTILDGGLPAYQEVHSVLTNDYGLFSVNIGEGGATLGTFAGLDWSTEYNLRVEIDKDGTNNFVNMGLISLVSVPYSLYADRAATADMVDMSVGELNDVIIQNPAVGEVLKWDGLQWVSAPDEGGTYDPGAGISISNDSIINTGDTDPNDDIIIGSQANGDLGGTYPSPQVVGIQGRDVSVNAPNIGDVLKWNGTEWSPAIDDITPPGGLVNVTPRFSGTGSISQPLDIAQQGATPGQALKWNGLFWAPANDSVLQQSLTIAGNVLTLSNGGGSVVLPGANYSPGPGVSILGNVISNTGDLDPNDDIEIGTPAGGDLGGTFPNPQVIRLRGNTISSLPAQANEVLKFQGGQWVPQPDLVNDADANPTNEIQTIQLTGNQLTLTNGGGAVNLPTFIAGPGISIVNGVVTNTGDLDPTNDIVIGSAAGGDLGGTYPNPSVQRIYGFPVSNNAPADSQVFKWVGGQWTPATDRFEDADANPTNEIQSLSLSGNQISLSNGGGSVNLPVYTGGTAIDVNGTVINNTGDTDPTDDINIGDLAQGDLSGTYPAPSVVKLRGRDISNAIPQNNQILKYNSVQAAWVPQADLVNDADPDPLNEIQIISINPAGDTISLSNGGGKVPLQKYVGGTGIQVLGTTIVNTGDLDPNDDVNNGDAALGDLSGTYPNPTVVRIQNLPVSSQTPGQGEILRWNGTQWAPGKGDNLLYNPGPGINITGSTIINTGDTTALDDITNTTPAAGDLTGIYPNPTVRAIQGIGISPATPVAGQVIKFQNGNWEPAADLIDDADANPTNEIQALSISGNQINLSNGGGSVNLPVYTGGPGIQVSGNTIINTGDLNPGDDITQGSVAAGDLNGTYPNPTVARIQNVPVTNIPPTNSQILKYQSGVWQLANDLVDDADNDASNEIQSLSVSGTTLSLSNGGGSVSLLAYQAGAGVSITGNTIANTGDLNPADDITNTTTALGDVSGTFPTLTVGGIQGNPVNAATPGVNQILKYNGASWVAADDENTTYTAGTGIQISNDTIFNDGDLNAADDITIGTAAGGDLDGAYPAPSVAALQGNPLNAPAPNAGEVLKYNGTQWVASPDDNTGYTAGAGISLAGNVVTNTGDTLASDDITDISVASGDVTGTFSNLEVVALRNRPLSISTPVAGQVLKYDGTQWSPAVDDNTSYSAGPGLSLTGTTFINTGDTNPADDLTNTSVAGGDATGTFSNLTVTALQNQPVSNTIPTAGQTLKYVSGQWVPQPDLIDDADNNPANEIQQLSISGNNVTLSNGGGTIILPPTTVTAGPGIAISGTTIINLGDLNGNDDVKIGDAASGDLSGTYPDPTVVAIHGRAVDNTAPANNQVLKWNGAQWAPVADEINDADADPINEIQNLTVNGTDLTLSSGGGTVSLLAYQAGTGVSISGNTINNTGDVNAADDITTSSTAGGDVNGVFSNLSVVRLQGTDVAATIPAANQVLKYNGTDWAPAGDDVNDADANPTNELQTISASGTDLTLSNNGGTVSLLAYQAGTGVSISGNTINNTGDVNAADDITTSSTAGGDVSGNFANLTVTGLQGTGVSGTAPAADQVLKYNGTTWAPGGDAVNDADANPGNELQTISASGTDLTLSNNGGTVSLLAYQAGTGVSISGNTINNTGDVNAGDDITITSNAGGDASGTFSNLTITGLQGTGVSGTAPAADQVLKYNGTTWAPGGDAVNDADSDPGNEIQNISVTGTDLTLSNSGGTVSLLAYQAGTGVNITGNTINNTGDVNASDDITTSSNAGGDVSGNFANLTVTGLQGTGVSGTAPAADQVLKYNGTTWTPAGDAVNDADANPFNEIQTLSISGTNISLSGGGGTVALPPTTLNAGPGISISGTTITNIGDVNEADDINIGDAAGGDLSGTYPDPTVGAIQGRPVANTAPAANQILKWNGTSWVPQNDDNTTYSAGSGISIAGTVINNTGDLNAGDDITNTTNALGDVSGTFPTLTVTGLQGTGVANTAPVADQVLKYNGVTWAPAGDAVNDADFNPANELQTISVAGTDLSLSAGGGTVSLLAYQAGTGINITGNTINNTGDTNPGDDLTVSSTAGGDATGTFANLTVTGLQGTGVSGTAPAVSQVLKYNGVNWAPAADAVNDADADAANELQTISVAGSDLTLSSGGGTVSLLTYQAGAGIAISGNTISNTGDANASDDITTSTTAGGDVGGTFSNLSVEGLQGTSISPTAPATNQVLKYNGVSWAPAADAVDDADANSSNELQTLTVVGTDLTLSNGGGTASLLAYQAGPGIGITGNTISNLGDTNASDDITIASNAGGDATGNFSNLVITGLQGTGVSGVPPTANEVLKYDGSVWAAGTDQVDDADADPNNELQTISVTGTDLTLSDGGGTASLLAYQAGTGISITGNTIANTGDTNAADDLTVISTAGGDASGTFANLTVTRLQGTPVSGAAPTTGQVIRYNGTFWAPSALAVADVNVDASWIPDTDNAYTLGNGTFRWSEIFSANGTVNTSDLRMKQDVEDLQYGLDEVLKLRPVAYNWKSDPNGPKKVGLIAQEVLPVIEEVVKTSQREIDPETGTVEEKELDRYGIYYSDLIPVVIKAVQEQQEMIESQKDLIVRQGELIEKLEARLNELEK